MSLGVTDSNIKVYSITIIFTVFLVGSDETSTYSNSPTSPNGAVLLSPTVGGGNGLQHPANNIPVNSSVTSTTNGSAVPSSQSVQQQLGNMVGGQIMFGNGVGSGGGGLLSQMSQGGVVPHSQSAHQLGLQQQQQQLQQQLQQQHSVNGPGAPVTPMVHHQQALHQQLQQHFAAAAAAHTGNIYNGELVSLRFLAKRQRDRQVLLVGILTLL